MQILLVGSGHSTSQLNMLLTQHDHSIAASVASLSPVQLNLFNEFEVAIVIGPEASITTDLLSDIAQRNKLVVVIAGISDGLRAWASAGNTPCYAYPLSSLEQDNLLEYLNRYASGGIDRDDLYRRRTVGSDLAARIQSGMTSVRKIVVTSPKGGTGKTTVAVNLAVAYALSGISTYLVDADGNAGALSYHLRLFDIQLKETMIGLLRKVGGWRQDSGSTPFETVAKSGRYLNAFTSLPALPTLRVLPGLVTENLGDPALQSEENIDAVIKGLFDAGAAANGVVIMDVGINPSHPVHRAALANADEIAIVIKPELPDIGETQRWVKLMIAALSAQTSRKIATEFIGSRLKLCYNQVFDPKSFKDIHHALRDSVAGDQNIGFSLVPNGVLPDVDRTIAYQAVSSTRVTDIFIWRYKAEHTQELAAFSDALISFGTQFIPVLREAAVRIGLVQDHAQSVKRKSLFSALKN
jgi:MinD-like ATPase involved in chromosome partitioning or flagellar assembly